MHMSEFIVGLRHECVMSPSVFNICIDGCVRQMKARVGGVGTWLRLNRVK